VDISAIPLLFAAFKFRKSMIPVVVAIVFSFALPWCQRSWTEYYNYGNGRRANVYNEPSLAAHALVAAFAVLIVWWGFRHRSPMLSGLGVLWFAIAALWLSFSHLLGDFSRVLTSQALEAAAALFIVWWGVRLANKILVNLGVVGFAIVVVWFYFSDIFDKLDRSLGLIGLGILFLAGGWALEKMRRNLVAGMNNAEVSGMNSREAI
jgi:hypothetical protein